jgi:hypothetical protein
MAWIATPICQRDMSACEAALLDAISCPDTTILEFLIAKGANVKECEANRCAVPQACTIFEK